MPPAKGAGGVAGEGAVAHRCCIKPFSRPPPLTPAKLLVKVLPLTVAGTVFLMLCRRMEGWRKLLVKEQPLTVAVPPL